ncbi:MAG: B12-binding domain-containing radical SAM protein [Proteobacteria bacterium]|nr:B12-binding domain-containing radical SAM protein [Pseudomonadota bacterium]MBU4296666.1 B12-binding domain-containing radical SAM protein [Pseudomonadota bacterium]MCG2748459.1 B12-binding domain-containing radical SAM protein [Desulfobulbaceae bacterium]
MTKLNTLLLRLPLNLDNRFDRTNVLQLYGLAMVSAAMKAAGRQVTLYDAYAYNLTPRKILQYVVQQNPDVIGLTLYTVGLARTLDFIADMKSLLPKVKIVVGGPHATAESRTLLANNKDIDIAVIGEGEETFVELVKVLAEGDDLKNVDGIAYKDTSGEVIVNKDRSPIENLDTLPFADWDSLPMARYWSGHTNKKNYVNLVANRGCAYSCIFCGSKITLGRKVRQRSIDSIIAELKFLHKQHHVRQIMFSDSTFNLDDKWLNDFCHRLLSESLSFKWECNIRGNLLRRDTLRLMKKAGCFHLFMGVESADNDMLKRMNKGETIEQLQKAIEILDEEKMRASYGFIMGLPGESEASLRKTIDFVKGLNKRGIYSCSLATPYPGTPFYRMALDEGWQCPDWHTFSQENVSYVPQGLTKKKLENFKDQFGKATNSAISLKPSFILNQLLQVQSPVNLWIKIGYGYRLFMKRLLA